MSEHDTTAELPRRRPDPSGDPGDPVRPSTTGDAAVDGALADLDAIDPELGPGQQLPVLAAVHEALQQRLSSTEG